ncbi:hypothetical protein [Clostridium sulfidigenes]|uniref:LptM family lipoprotein n=1 Tax=Clostridium sulfidigenes TaxID=318464 RepID=UPI003F8B8CAD
MKRKRLIALLCTATFLLAGCGNSGEAKNTKEGDTTAATENNESIEVDKGLLDVTLTLPASIFEGEDINAKAEEMKNDGAKETTVNEDGSMTVKMSKSKHKEMMTEMKTSVIKSIEDIKTSGDYPSIKDVKYNDDFTNITLEVVQAEYEESLEALATFGIGIAALYYNVYSGVETEKIHITIDEKNFETGEVFDTVVYPDDLEDTK